MKIILERNLDFNQFKNVFILNFICFFIFLMLWKYESDYKIAVLRLLFGLLISLCICLMLLKKGIIIEEKSIYMGYFLFDVKLMKKKVQTEGMKIITLLKYIKTPNYNYPKRHPSNITRWEPNLNYETDSFELYLLNENHTIKRKITSFAKEKNSTKAIEFILNNTEMKIEVYRPNFS